jgi:hypothetical protein
MPSRSLCATLLLSAATLVCASPLSAQQYDTLAVRTAVLAVVDSALGYINTGNMTGLSDMMTPEGQVYAARERDGAGGAFTMRTVAAQRATVQRAPIIERGFNPTVHLAGTIASVWLPYDLWADGKWSHCGIDHFTLVKVGSAWRIANLTYTIEQPPACRMHPDGVPKGLKPPM